jgi:hypothetical protein
MSDGRSTKEDQILDDGMGTKHVLLWIFAVVVWVVCLPIYIPIWIWEGITGTKVRFPMFTGIK